MKKQLNFWIKNISILLIYITASFFAAAESPTNVNNIEELPIAIQGFDIVTYYQDDTAHKGVKTFQAAYKGQRYLFTSQKNQMLFADDPESFLPEFGGFCSHSASQEKLVASDPSIYIVEKGNLYFFRDTTTKNLWDEADDKKIVKANKYWKYQEKNINEKLKAKKLWKEKSTVTIFTF